MESEHKVRLDIFEGPLDLLLYLIKKDEVDIYEISIERITRQYLVYMDTFKMLNIDLASEFIVMAANLMYLKSRTLLPKHQQPPEEDVEEEDPRWELIRQLIEYKKFKDAASFLQMREIEQGAMFRALPEVQKNREEGPEPLPEVGIFDLIRAFQKILDRFNEKEAVPDFREIIDERFTVADKIDHLLNIVLPGGTMNFASVFESASSRNEVIVTFLALLELMKLNQFVVKQDNPLGEIILRRREDS